MCNRNDLIAIMSSNFGLKFPKFSVLVFWDIRSFAPGLINSLGQLR